MPIQWQPQISFIDLSSSVAKFDSWTQQSVRQSAHKEMLV